MTTVAPRFAPSPRHRDAVWLSPFEVAVAGDGAGAPMRSKADLLALSRRAEDRALRGARTGAELVLISLQDSRFWTARTQQRYELIARTGATVVVFGAGLPTDVRAALRGGVATVGLADDDLLCDEWNVLFCSPTQRWGFVARDAAAVLPGARSGPRQPPAEDDRPDRDREFRWADLRDPVWLERAAAVLLTRVPELGASVPWLSQAPTT